MHVAAIIAAGGRGERLGASVPKPLVEIGGRAMLEWSVERFLASDRVRSIVVVLPADLAANSPRYLVDRSKPIVVVAGGERRQDSVTKGFAALASDVELAVIHDAARPFVSASLIARTVDAAAEHGAAIAAVRASDTVKRALPDEPPRIAETLPRREVYLAQTPQAFRREILAHALGMAREQEEATDEAMLVERAGYRVHLVEGERRNIKITTEEDLVISRALVTDASSVRAGIGYDLHRLVEHRPLVLGGVTLPFDRGLAGHSDADALCHAITDAILGAAGAGDIGGHFPDSDRRWKDASSLELLRLAATRVTEAGFEVANIDAVVIAERPRLGPYVREMAEKIAHACGIDASQVSIKGKTHEGVGELGRGEAIAVHAVATVRRHDFR
ncbi:MAG: 2-C-methyl-D-erythritol 4-phosphate cytidylyltransferase [Acidobacteria bacterium]|nr:2-C-methyl-D-erythritol 4-phosphate cytidylyltransferase [Acidobacteriota bacterium]